MSKRIVDAPPPYTPAQVAHIFNVDPKTVYRWANAGKLKSFFTPGGHRRFPVEQFDHLNGSGTGGAS
jgi:excisionase family DNA binding protein